jgi:hypothetical protein
MATAGDIINAALKKIGALAIGETPPAEDSQDALSELNRMLASLSADGINLFYQVHESFALVVGDGDYSIGSGGDFNTVRPNEIDQAFIRDSASGDHELKIRHISEYWSLGQKSSSNRPTRLYYDTTYATGTIYFDSLPAAIETLHLVSQKPLTAFAALTTTVTLPGEYESALVNRLAVELAPYFGKSVGPELARADAISYGNLKARNLANSMKPATVSMPGRGGGGYNIDTDT